MRKHLIILFLGLSIVNCQLSTLSAQTQPGVVRTVSRPNHPSEKLSGVLLRVRGNHNAVLSTENGEFALLMQGLEPGQPYAISSVVKSGYQLREPEMIGRQQSFSTVVPLEIVMISTQVLMQEQARIEEKARANVEANYQKRVTELDQALAAAKISNDQYETQLTALEEQYERFEPLLQTMSRYYALTDYDERDSLSARINERIEAGDLDEAERLIKAKGNMADREAQLRKLEEQNKRTEQLLAEAQKRLQEQQAEAKRQLKDLAEDCYHLFTIHLERFENDSAEYYICRRAQLDTANVEYQLVAGNFLMDYRAKYDLADAYFRKALRLAKTQYGEVSGDVATALSGIGLCYLKQKKFDEALDFLKQSAALSEQLRGKQSIAMAESYDNLGALYLKTGDTKEALSNLREAVKLYEKLCPPTDPYIPRSRNNLGNALFAAKKYDEAKACFEQALNEFQARYGEKHYDVANVYNNLAAIAFVQGRLDDSKRLFEKSMNLFTQILGPHHPKTQQAQRNLEHVKHFQPQK